MKDCHQFKHSFSNYIEKELPLETCKQIDFQLKNCQETHCECKEVIQYMCNIRKTLQQLPQVSTSSDFEQKLHRRIKEINQTDRVLRFPLPQFDWKIPAIASVAAMFIVGFLIMYTPKMQEADQEDTQKSGFAPHISKQRKKNTDNLEKKERGSLTTILEEDTLTEKKDIQKTQKENIDHINKNKDN